MQMRLGGGLHWYGMASGAASCQGRKLLIDFPRHGHLMGGFHVLGASQGAKQIFPFK